MILSIQIKDNSRGREVLASLEQQFGPAEKIIESEVTTATWLKAKFDLLTEVGYWFIEHIAEERVVTALHVTQ